MNSTQSNATELWRRYKEYLFHDAEMGFSLDISRMNFSAGFLQELEPRVTRAYQAMDELEKGAIANPDEGRRVGHYWLRAPQLAPDNLGSVIKSTWKKIKAFAAQVHEGAIVPE